MKRVIKTVAALLALSAVACSSEIVDYSEPIADDSKIPVVNPPSQISAPLTSVVPEDVKGSNSFALKFYLANAAKLSGNVCVSPFSVGAVLGMIANGDDGICRDEILSLLGFEEGETGLAALNTHYQTLLSNLPNIDDYVKCNFTNTLWCDPEAIQIRQPFMETLSDHYYTTRIDISPYGEYGKNSINRFVSKNTNNLIPEFLQQPLDVNLAFLNTSYFKAPWMDSFDKDNTEKRTFHDINHLEQQADFMCLTTIPECAILDDGSEVVRLMYGTNRHFSITLILPPSTDASALDEALNEDYINSVNGKLKDEKVKIILPKFEVEYNNPNTLDILKEIGLENVCSGMPFNLISDSNDYLLSCFIHATKLKIDEDGTEGAAASLGGFIDMAGPSFNPTKPREIVFDHPFIFYIQENTTGSILFIGSVKTFS